MTEIETPDGAMPAFVASPDREAKGAVVVVHEAFGLTTHIEAVTRRLAEVGWLAVAPSFFHREGSPVLAYDDYQAVLPVIGRLSAEGLATDLRSVLGYLDDQGHASGATGIVGFCMGGAVALYAGTMFDVAAAVTFYGGGVVTGRFGLPPLVELAPRLRAPWLGLYGDLDQSIPPDTVEQLRRAAARAPVETEVVRYPDADHGFNCDDRPKVYNDRAAADAWGRTLAWFDRHVA